MILRILGVGGLRNRDNGVGSSFERVQSRFVRRSQLLTEEWGIRRRKMPDLWLILDVPFLAHRASHSVGGLSHGDEPTSVVFGLMRDLIGWREVFQTDKVVFCFDRGRNKRLELCPEYKQNRLRAEETEEERQQRARLHGQIRRLMEDDLFRLGYRNVFWEEGYEADDVIASIVLSSLSGDDEAVIVSSDSDLYQLIGPSVSTFDPRVNKRRTLQWFHQQFGIAPSQWADVKAICGCGGDNVEGVRGVGEKSALLFLKGLLKTESTKFKRITENNELWKRNLRLVQLPFVGAEQFLVREDKVTKERWRGFCDSMGMKTLRMAYV